MDDILLQGLGSQAEIRGFTCLCEDPHPVTIYITPQYREILDPVCPRCGDRMKLPILAKGLGKIFSWAARHFSAKQ